MNNLFLIFVKVIMLLIGIAMLIGGGLCSIAVPFLGSSSESQLLIPTTFISVVVIGLLIALTIKLPFSQQAKYLALLIGGLFWVGGGLCATNAQSQAMSGLLLLNLAVALCGYLLVRWIIKTFKRLPPSNPL